MTYKSKTIIFTIYRPLDILPIFKCQILNDIPSIDSPKCVTDTLLTLFVIVLNLLFLYLHFKTKFRVYVGITMSILMCAHPDIVSLTIGDCVEVFVFIPPSLFKSKCGGMLELSCLSIPILCLSLLVIVLKLLFLYPPDPSPKQSLRGM